MNEDLDYIKKFSKITITRACELANVKKNNLWSGKVKKEKILGEYPLFGYSPKRVFMILCKKITCLQA